jgi:hypothetical protein
MLKKAIEAYDRSLPNDQPRLMSCNVISFSAANYERFVEILRSLRAQMMSLANDQERQDVVYAFSLNFFPCSIRLPDTGGI